MKTPFQHVWCGLIALGIGAGALAEDRLNLSANGSTLTDTNGGAGGSLGWLHNFNSGALWGVAGEYQSLADSHWQFGTLNAAFTGGTAQARWSVYGEARRGNGQVATRDFTYQMAAVGTILPLTRKLSMQLEDRQIDVDTTHGNLPKLNLSYLWTPRLQTDLSYSHAAGGNLRTELVAGRLDYYGREVHFLMGAAVGLADAAAVNIAPGLTLPGHTLREGFIGFSRAYRRTDFSMLLDYLELADSERITLTLGCTLHLNAPARAP